MDESTSLRVSTGHWRVPKCTAEVDVSKRIRVYVGKCVRIGTGAIKGVTVELAVADVVEVGLHSLLSRRIISTKPSIVTTTFSTSEHSNQVSDRATHGVKSYMTSKYVYASSAYACAPTAAALRSLCWSEEQLTKLCSRLLGERRFAPRLRFLVGTSLPLRAIEWPAAMSARSETSLPEMVTCVKVAALRFGRILYVLAPGAVKSYTPPSECSNSTV